MELLLLVGGGVGVGKGGGGCARHACGCLGF